MKSQANLRFAAGLLQTAASIALLATLTGCAGFTTTATPSPIAGASFRGSVHGGQQPVSGAQIFLLSANTSSYGGGSSSILTSGPGILQNQYGSSYATTDANGNFAFTNYNCPSPTSQVYLFAAGGNPGFGGNVNNTAIAAIAAIGNCNNITTSSFFAINEVTTAAFVFAAQQFIGSDVAVGAPSSNAAGLANAFLLTQDLVSTTNAVARTTNAAGTGASPQAKLNTLANIIAPCLNSASNTSSACTSLFAAVTPSGSNQPNDTVGALLLIAQNPGVNVTNINALASAAPPFQPYANVTNDFTLAITYSGGGMTAPGDIVIDAAGDAYIGNSPSTAGASGTDSIVGFSPTGVVLTGANGYTNGIHSPNALAIDNAGNIWSTNIKTSTSPDQVVKLTSAGALSFAFNDSNLNNPQGLAIDNANNAWVANAGNFKLVKISPAGADTLAFTSSGFFYPTGIGIDGSGFIFAAGQGSNSILKFNSAGTVLSPAAGYKFSGLSQPLDISIDAADHIWSIQNNSSAIIELNGADGSGLTPPAVQSSLSDAYVLAIDGAGGAWYANCRGACGANTTSPDNLTHAAPGGAQATGTADGYQDSHLSRVGTAAVDGTGNVWVTNNGGGTVTVFLGVAPPVVTPIAVGTANNTLGTRP